MCLCEELFEIDKHAYLPTIIGGHNLLKTLTGSDVPEIPEQRDFNWFSCHSYLYQDVSVFPGGPVQLPEENILDLCIIYNLAFFFKMM